MIKKVLFISLLVALVSLVGCQEMGPGTPSTMFIRDASTCGVWVGGRQAIVKSENLHQESRRGKAYRIQTDDQLVYINILLNSVPTSVGDKCTATITSKGIYEIQDVVLDMTLQKSQDDMMWLWNEGEKVGVVMPILH